MKGGSGECPSDTMRKAVARLVDQDRKRRLTVTVLAALLVAVAVGVAVEDMDSAYLANKMNLVAYVPDRVTAGGPSTIMVFATDGSGEPADGKEVDVRLVTEDSDTLVWSGRTGADGSASPTIDFPVAGGKVRLIVRSGVDVVETTTVLDDSVRIVITTDKPVYRPGDTIHMRFLTYAGMDPLPQESSLLAEATDPNGDKIFKKLLSPDEYGICAYDLRLSDQLNQGTYTISATVGGKTVTKALAVKDYVLPKFRVDLLGTKDWYEVDDGITGTVSAEYFFGEVVAGTVEVEANVYLGVWETYYVNTFTLYGGEAYVTIPAVGYAVGLSETGGNGYIQLNITVTDTAGHSEVRYKVIPVAPSGLVLSVLTDSCIDGMQSKYYVIARSPDGRPVANASIQLALGEGTSYHTKASATTDERGVAALTFEYDGQPSARVYGSSTSGSALVYADVEADVGLKVVADQTSYDVGGSAHFDIFYSGDSMTANVYWDLVSRGYLVDRGVVQLDDGQASLDLTLGPDAEPFAQLRVYKIEGDIGVTRDAVTFSVGSSSVLSASVTADDGSYYPRDEVGLSFYANYSGSPTVAALGVSVVDEAVYEVGSMFQGFEEIIFGLDAEFVIPQYQILTYVYAGTGTLPSDSEEVVSEMDEARLLSTWPDNLADAEEIRADATMGYWFGLYLCALAGLMIFMGTRPKRRNAPVLAFAVIIVLAIAGSAATYVMTLGFGSNTSQDPDMIPRDPRDDIWEQNADFAGGLDDWDTAYSDESDTSAPDGSVSRPSVVRQYFPETWYWNPCLLTGEDGWANISLTAPDSITSWQVDIIASTADGTIGTGTGSVTVFQPFFVEPDIPVSVVRGDEFPLRVMVYNYLDAEQVVNVTLADEPWLTLLSPANQSVTVPANYVTSVSFTIAADKVGWHTVSISASSAEASDAVVRPMEVVPDGKKVETLYNGEVGNGSADHTLYLQPDMIEGSANAWVKIQGGVDAVLLEGVDEFIQHVSGCGEQSLSMLSIDILAYATVMELGATPEMMFEYESIVNQGLQHELMYLLESNNGVGRGIVWFPGDQDVHPWLTSWGLIAFQDAINAGFGLDGDIITDMQDWLMSIQQDDGSWEFPDWGIYEFNNPILQAKEVAATGYIARALLHSGVPGDDPHIQAAGRPVQPLALSAPPAGGGRISVHAHADRRVAGGAQGGRQRDRALGQRREPRLGRRLRLERLLPADHRDHGLRGHGARRRVRAHHDGRRRREVPPRQQGRAGRLDVHAGHRGRVPRPRGGRQSKTWWSRSSSRGR